MERKVNDKVPDASTLWLAIGIGAFSVLTSFFLAIYFAAMGQSNGASAAEAQTLETAANPAD